MRCLYPESTNLLTETVQRVGDTIPGFIPTKYNYSIQVPFDVEGIPALVAHTQDPNAIECPLICVDTDLDGYAIDGGDCGQVDCDDKDASVSPGEGEVCDDGIDNDCDGSIEEGCDATCPDVDGDGYQDAACGGDDCNDSDAAINPGTAEVLGNGTDENCNGTSDDTSLYQFISI